MTAYHLALKAGPDERAQRSSLALIDQLGERFTAPVIGQKKKGGQLLVHYLDMRLMRHASCVHKDNCVRFMYACM